MRNKTKFLLISALSLCTLSAGVTAVMASAEGETENTALELTFAGASIRYAEEGKQDGIRFAIEMSAEDWNDFGGQIKETYVTISNGTKTGAALDTSNDWYPVDATGEYAEENVVAYRAVVCLYGNFATTENFQVEAVAKFYDEATPVATVTSEARSMEYVAIQEATKNPENAGAIEAYLPSYTVSFEGVEATQTVKYGKFAVAPETEPTKEGYTFTGWDYDFTKAVTGDVTVKATWEVAVDLMLIDFENTVSGDYSVTGANSAGVSAPSFQPSGSSPGAAITWWCSYKNNGAKAIKFYMNAGEATIKVKLTEAQLQELATSKTISLLASGFMGSNNGNVFNVNGTKIAANYGSFPAWTTVIITGVEADADGFISFKASATNSHAFFCIDDIRIMKAESLNWLVTDFENMKEGEYSSSGAMNAWPHGNGFTPSVNSSGAAVTWWVNNKKNGTKSFTFNMNAGDATIKVKLTEAQLQALATSKTISLLASGSMGSSNGNVLKVNGAKIGAGYASCADWTVVTITGVEADADGFVSIKASATNSHAFFCIDDLSVLEIK